MLLPAGLFLFLCVGTTLLSSAVWGTGTVLLSLYETHGKPLLERLEWTEERSRSEGTYYARTCTHHDISTLDASDLFVEPPKRDDDDDDNDSHNHAQDLADRAYDTFLEHGFAVLPDVLPPAVRRAARDSILQQNIATDPTGRDWNALHAPEHRWLAEFPADPQTPMADALQALATHAGLRRTLARLYGHSDDDAPAIIEFNAITSAPGAVAQPWHSDGVSPLVNHARSFAATHVLLMQLQDTPAAMGPTQVCPGTHMCNMPDDDRTAPIWRVCEQHGPQVTNEEGLLPGGSVVLMNTNALHRGSAYRAGTNHTDPRVMLVLTLAPRPRSRAEGRLITQGLSFSMHWSLFGKTLRSSVSSASASASWFPALPWLSPLQTFWHSLWDDGYNLVLLYFHRLANGDEAGNLSGPFFENFRTSNPGASHSLPRWPRWLRGQLRLDDDDDDDDYYWTDFFLATAQQIVRWAQRATLTAAAAGVPLMRTRRRMAAMAAAAVVPYLCGTILLHPWIQQQAMFRDIAHGLVGRPAAYAAQSTDVGPTVFPTPADWLVETRLGSRSLGMYQDQLEYHPGNRIIHETILPRYAAQNFPAALHPILAAAALKEFQYEFREYREYRNYYSDEDDNDSSDDENYEIICTHTETSRILQQSPATGNWQWLDSAAAAEAHMAQALLLQKQSRNQNIARNVRDIQSECDHGLYRNTALCRHGAVAAARAVPAGSIAKAAAVSLSSAPPPIQLGPSWRSRRSPLRNHRAEKTIDRSVTRNPLPTCEIESHDDPIVEGKPVMLWLPDLAGRIEATIRQVHHDGKYQAEARIGPEQKVFAQELELTDFDPWTAVEAESYVYYEQKLHVVQEVQTDKTGRYQCRLGSTGAHWVPCDALIRGPEIVVADEEEDEDDEMRVLAFFQDEANPADHGWFEATVWDEEENDFFEVEFWDGSVQTLHYRLLREYKQVKVGEAVGSPSGFDAMVHDILQHGHYCWVQYEDESTELVECKQLKRFPKSTRFSQYTFPVETLAAKTKPADLSTIHNNISSSSSSNSSHHDGKTESPLVWNNRVSSRD